MQSKAAILLAILLETLALFCAPLLVEARPGEFAQVRGAHHFIFPRDHGSHPAYRTEWWYFTGHLQAEDGHLYGYELTCFRVGLHPGDPAPLPTQSAWRSNELYPAHFAISDITQGQFLRAEHFERGSLGLAASSQRRLDVHVEGWHMRMDDAGIIHLDASTPAFALHLHLHTLKPIVIEGEGGISRKGSCASCASVYYSYTRLESSGELTVGSVRQSVHGLSWMDHEYGSDQLESGVIGWDWFAIMLDDGREMMVYRLRRQDGSILPQSSGTVVAQDGTVRYLKRDDITVQANAIWQSPRTQAKYPSAWNLSIPATALNMQIEPLLRDQELAGLGSPAYWEGAADVRDLQGHHIGSAYVELTGYNGPIGRL